MPICGDGGLTPAFFYNQQIDVAGTNEKMSSTYYNQFGACFTFQDQESHVLFQTLPEDKCHSLPSRSSRPNEDVDGG